MLGSCKQDRECEQNTWRLVTGSHPGSSAHCFWDWAHGGAAWGLGGPRGSGALGDARCLTTAPLPQPARHCLRLVPQPPQVHQVPHLHAVQVAHHQDRAGAAGAAHAGPLPLQPPRLHGQEASRGVKAPRPPHNSSPGLVHLSRSPLAWTFQSLWGAWGAPCPPLRPRIPGPRLLLTGLVTPQCPSSPPQACCLPGPAPLGPACGVECRWGSGSAPPCRGTTLLRALAPEEAAPSPPQAFQPRTRPLMKLMEDPDMGQGFQKNE